MNVQSALDKEAQRRLEQTGNADIVIGIPSYNNANTIGHVAEVAAQGAAAHFPRAKALIMNSDGGSTDGTGEAFLEALTARDVQALVTRYQGMPGKGSALRAIFEACAQVGAKACVLVDSDLRSITPEWVQRLAGPIMEGAAGYVTPLYLRHKYDGTITNSLAYPFTRALYGIRVRQPIGGDFGVSGALAESFLEKDVWNTSAAQFGIDIFMTTTAITGGFEIMQANLGAKIHDAKDPAAHLGPMFRQVVGAMFSLMGAHEDRWLGVKGSAAPATVGPSFAQEPEPVGVTLEALVQKFKAGVEEQKGCWAEFLPSDMVAELEELARLGTDSFRFPVRLWVRLVYHFAVACNRDAAASDQVVDSLTPLYFGRTAGFVRESAEMSSAQAEEVIERVAEHYEKEKPYLVDLWSKR